MSSTTLRLLGSFDGDELVLQIEGVDRGHADYESGKLRVQQVSTIEEEDLPIHGSVLGAGFDSGSILTLTMTGGVLSMIVQWHNYALRSDRTAVYRIVGAHVAWEPAPPGGWN